MKQQKDARRPHPRGPGPSTPVCRSLTTPYPTSPEAARPGARLGLRDPSQRGQDASSRRLRNARIPGGTLMTGQTRGRPSVPTPTPQRTAATHASGAYEFS